MNQNEWNEKLNKLFQREDRYLKYYKDLKNDKKPFSKCLVIYVGGIFRNKDEFDDINLFENYLKNDIKTNQSLCNIQKTYLSDNGLNCLVLNDYNKIIYYKIKLLKKFMNKKIDKHLWKKIANNIKKKYDNFDGFVIIHSIDYLEHSASALSYMCQNLSKPILFTSSIYKDKGIINEYYENLKNSIIISSLFKIPEVCIYYNDRLLRANRTIRINLDGIIPFNSPNYSFLGYYNVLFEPNWNQVRRIPNEENVFDIKTNFYDDVQVLTLNPYINYENLKYLINCDVKALVIESYGMGNFPSSNKALEEILKKLNEKGVIIVTITQCRKGFIDNVYATSKNNFGIIKANDMILPSILTKLGYLLGNYENIDEIKQLITKDLRGEITEIEIVNKKLDFFDNTTKDLNLSKENKLVLYNSLFYKSILFKSIMSNNENLFKDVLKENHRKDIKIEELRDYYGRNILHYFSYNECTNLIDYFFKLKIIDINSLIKKEDNDGINPMLFALIKKNINILYYFKQKKCFINLNIKILKKLWINAILDNDLNFIKLLYFCGFKDFDKVKNMQNRHVLFYAAIYNKKEIFDFLVSTVKMDVDIKDSEGNYLENLIDFKILISKEKFERIKLQNKKEK